MVSFCLTLFPGAQNGPHLECIYTHFTVIFTVTTTSCMRSSSICLVVAASILLQFSRSLSSHTVSASPAGSPSIPSETMRSYYEASYLTTLLSLFIISYCSSVQSCGSTVKCTVHYSVGTVYGCTQCTVYIQLYTVYSVHCTGTVQCTHCTDNFIKRYKKRGTPGAPGTELLVQAWTSNTT